MEIDNVAGLIDVQGWDKSEVAVTGTIGKDVERVDVTGDSNRTSIRVMLPKGISSPGSTTIVSVLESSLCSLSLPRSNASVTSVP